MEDSPHYITLSVPPDSIPVRGQHQLEGSEVDGNSFRVSYLCNYPSHCYSDWLIMNNLILIRLLAFQHSLQRQWLLRCGWGSANVRQYPNEILFSIINFWRFYIFSYISHVNVHMRVHFIFSFSFYFLHFGCISAIPLSNIKSIS